MAAALFIHCEDSNAQVSQNLQHTSFQAEALVEPDCRASDFYLLEADALTLHPLTVLFRCRLQLLAASVGTRGTLVKLG